MIEVPGAADEEEPDDIGTGLVLQVHTQDGRGGALHGHIRTPPGLFLANRDRPGLATVDQHRDGVSVTLGGVDVERVRASLTIGQEAHIDNLQAIVPLELLGHGNHRVHSFIERRTTEVESRRSLGGVRIRVLRDPQHHTGGHIELGLAHAARQSVEQVEVAEAEVITSSLIPVLVLLVLLAHGGTGEGLARHLAGEVHLRVLRRVRIGEQIDLVGDVDRLAEHDEVQQLVDRLAEVLAHRTRPVHAEDHAVVLTLGDLLGGEEDVISELVVVDTIHVDDTATGRTRTARLVGSHLHLKLLDEHLDGVRAVRAEILEQLLVVEAVTLRDSDELGNDGLEVNEDRIHVERRHLPPTNLRGRSVHHVLAVTLLGFRSHRTSRLAVLITTGRRGVAGLGLGLGRLRAVTLVLVLLLLTLALTVLRLIVALVTRAIGGIVTLTLTSRLGAGVAGTRGLTLRTVVGLVLLLLRSLTRTIVLVDLGSESDHIVPGLHRLKARKERSFVRSHRHGSDAVDARLEVDIETVEQREILHRFGVERLDAKEVLVEQILARFGVATLQTGEAILHLAVDTNVLAHIEVVVNHAHIDAGIRIDSGVRLVDDGEISRSEESVTDLVSAEHIVQVTAHLLPDGESENASAGIERCSLRGRVMHDREILGSQQTRECVLGSRVDGERVRNGSGRSLSHSAPIVPGPSGACKPLEYRE